MLPWMQLTFNTTLLMMESQSVIWTRLSQIALGRGTPAESMLMVTEKMAAFSEAMLTLAAGGSPQKVVRGYRRHVRANVRRLRKP
ncbi:hypothetical protein [Microvirga pudoricolor]|uniref:hypothetical protein n=1 Tax=Microvirga pudoricolor TaxID=2778729 RepID=UPI00194FE442|nr:hypothetical protein [Microvirga pudoricolor]MBM6593230.1 hypothetical protein [Microvirga pudoricolor]